MKSMFEWFYTKLQNLVVDILSSLGKQTARRIAAGVAGAAGVVTAFGVFYSLAKGLLTALYYVPDSNEARMAMYLFLPGNAPACISAMISARIALFAYTWVVWKQQQITDALKDGGLKLPK